MRKTQSLIQVAVALLDRPDDRHWGYDLTRVSGIRSGVLYPLLHRMLDEEWLADGWEELAESGGRPPRRYYVLISVGRRELGAIVESARSDARFRVAPAGGLA